MRFQLIFRTFYWSPDWLFRLLVVNFVQIYFISFLQHILERLHVSSFPLTLPVDWCLFSLPLVCSLFPPSRQSESNNSPRLFATAVSAKISREPYLNCVHVLQGYRGNLIPIEKKSRYRYDKLSVISWREVCFCATCAVAWLFAQSIIPPREEWINKKNDSDRMFD